MNSVNDPNLKVTPEFDYFVRWAASLYAAGLAGHNFISEALERDNE